MDFKSRPIICECSLVIDIAIAVQYINCYVLNISGVLQLFKLEGCLFKKHETSGCHLDTVEMTLSFPTSPKHIGVQHSQQFAHDMEDNREMFMNILSHIRV